MYLPQRDSHAQQGPSSAGPSDGGKKLLSFREGSGKVQGRSSSHSKICAVAASHRALVRSSPLVRTVLLNATQVSLLVLVLRLPQQSVAFTLPAANEPHSERFVGAPPPIHASHLQ